MLSISEAIKGVTDAVNYYLEAGKEAYYLAGIGQVGRWVGRAVALLQLPDQVTAEAFRNLLGGFSPDGRQPMVQNAGQPDRDAGWDLTFSVPKAVSVLWAMSSPSVRADIEAAQRHAVATALHHAEAIWGFTRRGQGGKRHEHAALLFATFEEYTSRAQDMQIHTHCVLINTTVRQDGTTGALHSINFFRAKLLLGALHETELAQQLRERLHVGVEAQAVGFGLAGLPESVCRHFSKRHTAIQQAMAERQLRGPIAAKVVTRETRPRKEHVPPGRLFSSWHEQGRSQGWGPEQAAKLVQAQHAVSIQPLEPVLRTTLAGWPREQQTRKRLINLARVTALQHGAGGPELLASLGHLHLPGGQTILWRPHSASKGAEPSSAREPRSHSRERRTDQPAQPEPSPAQVRTEPFPGKSEDQRRPKQRAAPEPATRNPASPKDQPRAKVPSARANEHEAAEPPPPKVGPNRPMPNSEATQKPTEAEQSGSAPEKKLASTQSPETPSPPSAQPPPRDHAAEATRAKPTPDQSAQQASAQRPPDPSASPGPASNEQKRSEESCREQQQNQQEQPGGSAKAEQTADESRSEKPRGQSAKPRQISREQRVRNRLFERAFGEAVDRIFPEKQTRARLTRLAEKLAREHRADDATLERTLRALRPGAERSFLHVENPRLFPNSPIGPLKWLRVRKLALGDQPNKWGDIRWKKDLVIGELRIQQRRLFPQADRWSPLHKLALPALHFSFQKSKWQPRKPAPERTQQNVQPPRTENRAKSGKDKQQDHSQSQ